MYIFFFVANCVFFAENRGYVCSYYWIFFDTLLSDLDVIVIKQKWMKISVFLSFFSFLIGGILRKSKSCDFWLISSVLFCCFLFERFCLVMLGTDVVFHRKSGRSNCIVFFSKTNWCCDCWYESGFAEMFLRFRFLCTILLGCCFFLDQRLNNQFYVELFQSCSMCHYACSP